MKARIKKTGEIIRLAEYAMITLEMCDSYGNPIEVKPEDVELIPDVKEDNFTETNWEQVRIQAAIAAIKGICSNSSSFATMNKQVIVKESIGIADAFVKELKGE